MNIQQYYNRFEAAKRALSIANGLGQPHRSKAMGLLNKHRAALKRAQTGKPKVKQYTPDFYTNVDGIPCGVFITNYQVAAPARHDDPGSDAWVEFILTDRNGYRAMWLEDKADMVAIEREALCYI